MKKNKYIVALLHPSTRVVVGQSGFSSSIYKPDGIVTLVNPTTLFMEDDVVFFVPTPFSVVVTYSLRHYEGWLDLDNVWAERYISWLNGVENHDEMFKAAPAAEAFEYNSGQGDVPWK